MFPSQDNATHHELAVDMEDWSGNRRFARWLFSSTTKTKTKKTKTGRFFHIKDKDKDLWGNRRFARWLVSSTSPNDSKL